MKLSGRSFRTILLVLLMIGAAGLMPFAASQAQGNAVTISLVVPSFNADAFNAQFMKDFETANPGIKLNIVKNDSGLPAVYQGTEAYFTALQGLVGAGDVLYIDSNRVSISPAATRAGYFLDLSPLVNQDKNLKTDDFFPAVWKSWQWDKGIWGMPVSADAIIMSYDKAAFDRAGIAYPNDKWTINDLYDAAQKLVEKDDKGMALSPAITLGGGADIAVQRTLIGEALFDPNTFPNDPKLDKPSVEALAEKWTDLDQHGYFASGGGFGGGGGSTTTPIPIQFSNASNLLLPRFGPGQQQNTNTTLVNMLLPGNTAGMRITGFAVSAGTQYPQQAYALLNYLTTQPTLIRGGISPARKSMVGAQASGNGQGGGAGGGPGGGGPRANRNLTPEAQAIVTKALTDGLPVAEQRFGEYLRQALRDVKADPTKLSVKDALQKYETQAVQDVTAATAKKQNANAAVVVATPVPVVALPANKVAIKFGLAGYSNPIPGQEKWDKLKADFVASDPQVGRVDMDALPNFNLNEGSTNYDCFYLPNNAVQSGNLGTVVPMDPFFDADKSFKREDLINNILPQVQRDNKTWAFPIVIEPEILRYNKDTFSRQKVAVPGINWSIDNFRDTVQSLKLDPADPPPFVPSGGTGTHLLMLITAYGGLPLDYRTNPITVNYTDPNTVSAIRNVLDLAKGGYIKYDAIGGLNLFRNGQRTSDVAIYTDTLNTFTFRFANANSGNNPYRPVVYPRNSKYAAISYNIGAGYISAKAQNPEACYRWISAISRRPDLFQAMPARRSLINDPAVVQAQGPDVAALYTQIDALMKDPNTIAFPSLTLGGGNISGLLLPHWLYQAFDAYVLNDGDLEASLKDAEAMSKGFQECTSKIAPFDPSTQNQRDYNRQFADCATKIDPSLKGIFGG